jgi:hypothetical protein
MVRTIQITKISFLLSLSLFVIISIGGSYQHRKTADLPKELSRQGSWEGALTH